MLVATLGAMPTTQSDQREPVVRVVLLVPESLHATMKEKARREDRSMHKTWLHAARLYVAGVLMD